MDTYLLALAQHNQCEAFNLLLLTLLSYLPWCFWAFLSSSQHLAPLWLGLPLNIRVLPKTSQSFLQNISNIQLFLPVYLKSSEVPRFSEQSDDCQASPFPFKNSIMLHCYQQRHTWCLLLLSSICLHDCQCSLARVWLFVAFKCVLGMYTHIHTAEHGTLPQWHPFSMLSKVRPWLVFAPAIEPIMRVQRHITWKPKLLRLVIWVSWNSERDTGFNACKYCLYASTSQARCSCVASVKCSNFGSPPTDFLGM